MTLPDLDLERGRLLNLRRAIEDAGCDAGLFYDPINIRYATGTSNMQVYSLHNPCRYVFVPVQGDVVLFEFKGCEHLATDHASVDEVRNAVSWYDFVSGSRTAEFAGRWATEIAALLGPDRRALAVDRLDPIGTEELRRHRVQVFDGQRVANQARMLKTAEELSAIRTAVLACDEAIDQMGHHLRPGITETELWAQLHRANIAAGGEWLETRLLTAGRRTNPWYQEASDYVIGNGDLVAFDTDLVGIGGLLGGYLADVASRRHGPHCEPAAPPRSRAGTALAQHRTDEARRFVCRDLVLGLPPRLPRSTRSPMPRWHTELGCATSIPLILNRDHFADAGYDGEICAGMVLCVEALAAPPGGTEAVKLGGAAHRDRRRVRRFSAASRLHCSHSTRRGSMMVRVAGGWPGQVGQCRGHRSGDPRLAPDRHRRCPAPATVMSNRPAKPEPPSPCAPAPET